MIRPARADDIRAIHQMIRELAVYEQSLHEVSATEDDLRAALLADQPSLFAHVAEQDGQTVGYALWYVTYSAWLGKHGIYLEDLYVKPEVRRQGHGRALLVELARICVERGYQRFDWMVFEWNSGARGFYESLGAAHLGDLTVYRLTGPALRALAGNAR